MQIHVAHSPAKCDPQKAGESADDVSAGLSGWVGVAGDDRLQECGELVLFPCVASLVD